MKKTTKQERTKKTLNIIQQYQNKTLSINQWLEIINIELNQTYTYRNTKELGHAFKNISQRENIKMQKNINAEVYKTSKVNYTFLLL